jgi:hypothetical protein
METLQAALAHRIGQNLLLKLTSEKSVLLGITSVNTTHVTGLKKEALQDILDGKNTLQNVMADKNNYSTIALSDIVSFSL